MMRITTLFAPLVATASLTLGAAAQVRAVPTQSRSARSAPVRSAPVRRAPARSAPVRRAPVRSAPIRRAPTPRRSTPIYRAPRRSAPVRSAPRRSSRSIPRYTPPRSTRSRAPIRSSYTPPRRSSSIPRSPGRRTTGRSSRSRSSTSPVRRWVIGGSSSRSGLRPPSSPRRSFPIRPRRTAQPPSKSWRSTPRNPVRSQPIRSGSRSRTRISTPRTPSRPPIVGRYAPKTPAPKTPRRGGNGVDFRRVGSGGGSAGGSRAKRGIAVPINVGTSSRRDSGPRRGRRVKRHRRGRSLIRYGGYGYNYGYGAYCYPGYYGYRHFYCHLYWPRWWGYTSCWLPLYYDGFGASWWDDCWWNSFGTIWAGTTYVGAPYLGYASYLPSTTIYIGGGTSERDEEVDKSTPEGLARYYVELGDLYFKTRRYLRAAEAYTRAVRLVSDDGSLRFVQADAWFAAGEYDKAAYAIRQGLHLDPGLAEVVIDKTEFYGKPEDFERHMKALRSHLGKRPYDTQARLVLAYNLRYTKQWDEAATQIEKLIEQLPGDRSVELLRDGLDVARKESAAPDKKK